MPSPSVQPLAGDLSSRLAHSDPEVRRIAVMELPYSDEDDILPPLLVAAGDPDALVRAEAAKALEGFEEPEAVQALLPLLRDAQEETRRAASDTLSELKESGNGELLLAWIADPDPFVQAAVFRALRALKVPGALGPRSAPSNIRSRACAVRRRACWAICAIRVRSGRSPG